MMIVNERWERLKRHVSPRTWERIKAKAQWEAVTLSAVVADWPMLLPKRLQKLASSCFVETRHELLVARQQELSRELRRVENQLSKELSR